MRLILLSILLMHILYGDSRSYINSLRQKAGMIPLKTNTLLESASYNHAKYLYDNELLGHFERESDPLFTGVSATDRGHHVGYEGNIIENIATDTEEQHAIDSLFSAIYHRFGFLDFEIDEIGFGRCCEERSEQTKVFVYNMANSQTTKLCGGSSFKGYGVIYRSVCKENSFGIERFRYLTAKEHNAKNNPPIVVWPASDAYGVPIVFYEELPDPLPHCSVSGYPISIQFNPSYFDGVTMDSFVVYDANSQPIEAKTILDHHNDPNQKLTPFEFAFMPLKRLAYNTHYSVRILYRVNGVLKNKEWSFQTKELPYPILSSKQRKESFQVKSSQEYIIDLVPKECGERYNRAQVSHYSTVKVEHRFLDANTISIKVTGASKQKVKLAVNGRREIELEIL